MPLAWPSSWKIKFVQLPWSLLGHCFSDHHWQCDHQLRHFPLLVQRANPFPIKWLLSSKMAAHREKSLYFNCEPTLFLCLMIDSWELPMPEDKPLLVFELPSPETIPAISWESDTPCISFYALMWQIIPSTLKITGSINGKKIIILVDGGSTNNLVQSKLATYLNLLLQLSSHLRVTVGNGDALTCGGECLGIPLKLGLAMFKVDLILLPVYGADIVLGVQWMRQLGPILFDYK